MQSIGSNFIGSISFYLLHFSAMLFSVSIAVSFMSSTSEIIGYVVAGLCLLLIVVYIFFLYKSKETVFFERLLEKVNNFQLIYLTGGIVVKMVLGFVIVFMSSMVFGGIIVTCLYLAWILAIIVKLKPFKNANFIRLIICFVLSLFIQSCYIYHNFSSSSTS